LPSVNRLYEEFKGQGLEVLLISFRESSDVVKRTVAERGYTAPVLLDAAGDLTGRVYGVFGPPTAYLVDREGRLVGRIVGGRDWKSAAARDVIRGFVGRRGP
jgi:peroxiredoxin